MNKKFLLIIITVLALTLIGFYSFQRAARSGGVRRAPDGGRRDRLRRNLFNRLLAVLRAVDAGGAGSGFPGRYGAWAGRLEADADRLFVYGENDGTGEELHADQDVRRLEDELDV